MDGNRGNEQRGGRGDGRIRAARPFGAPTLAWVAGLLLVAGAVAAAAAATPPAAGAAATEAAYEAQPLRVQVWHGKDDGDIYRRGETLHLGFETNLDAYVVVYRIDADGGVTILWPRSRYDDGFVFGGHEYSLPANGAEPLRIGADEGIEYVEALASLYPFDLRDLEVDFQAEPAADLKRFAVAGDPFLAMNEVNFTITGLEDPSDYVVTDYANWYVHRRVDHPRYLCQQCHEQDYRPYDDHCAIEIHYDFGWANSWYLRFGYYPVYYYPAFYYVDPWTWRPWVNYWYTPWYSWPSFAVYRWPYSYYPWWDSPYYHGDAWDHYRDGRRRLAPLSKLYRTRDREPLLRKRSPMVADRATPEVRDALRQRQPLSGGPVRVDSGRPSTDGRVKDVAAARPDGRGGYVNVEPTRRGRTALAPTTGRPSSRPGLRIGSGERPGSGTDTRAGTPAQGDSRGAPVRLRGSQSSQPGGAARPAEPGRTIRPVQPRKPGSRIWTGGRTSSQGDRRARPSSPSRPSVSSGDSRPSRSEAAPQRSTGSQSDRPAERSREVQRNQPQPSGNNANRSVDRPSAPARNSAPSRPSAPSQPDRSRSSSGGRTRSGGRG